MEFRAPRRGVEEEGGEEGEGEEEEEPAGSWPGRSSMRWRGAGIAQPGLRPSKLLGGEQGTPQVQGAG